MWSIGQSMKEAAQIIKSKEGRMSMACFVTKERLRVKQIYWIKLIWQNPLRELNFYGDSVWWTVWNYQTFCF